MNMQEWFDRIVKFAAKQNERSKSGETCLYRGARGKCCFVGAALPDKLYSEEMEGLSVSGLIRDSLDVEKALHIDGLSIEDTETFWRCLQILHDDAFVDDWPREFHHLAESYGLDRSVINEVFK